MRDVSVSKNNDVHSIIGVVGGGQLAQMLAEAAINREVDIIVQTESCDSPAGQKATRLVLAEMQDISGTSELVRNCRSVTFENEWIDVDALVALEKQGGCFIPPLAALAPLVDKIST